MFKNEVIDRYMHCIITIFFKNAQVSIYFLADLNIGHCVELTFLKANSEDCYWFITRFLYSTTKKFTQLALKKGQLDTMTYV